MLFFQYNAFLKGFLTLENPDDQAKMVNLESEKANQEAIKQQEEMSKLLNASVSKKVKTIDDMFGKDFHIEFLSRKPILTYKEVENQFNISIAGFGKGINFNGESVVLISSIKKNGDHFVYHDHWTPDGYYIYSGEGKNGNQSLTRGNKLIADTKTNNQLIHLFIKMSSSEYYYQGVMKLIEYYLERDNGEDGQMRDEYKFKLSRATI